MKQISTAAKFLIVCVALVSAPIFANAAYSVCTHTQQPCDQFGNHYYCNIMGASGPTHAYCSPTDQSASCEQRCQSNQACIAHCVMSQGW